MAAVLYYYGHVAAAAAVLFSIGPYSFFVTVLDSFEAWQRTRHYCLWSHLFEDVDRLAELRRHPARRHRRRSRRSSQSE